MAAAPDSFRCFIAIPADETIVAKLVKMQEELAQAFPRDAVRWTTCEQLHLTLKFLGSVPAGAMLELESALGAACEGIAPFRLIAQGVGAFPSLRGPKVLWAGLAGDIELLRRLQAQIDSRTSPWEQKAENREFHPHLTLGRVPEHSAHRLRPIAQGLQDLETREFGGWQVTEVHLVRSQLSSKGSTYTTLGAKKLG